MAFFLNNSMDGPSMCSDFGRGTGTNVNVPNFSITSSATDTSGRPKDLSKRHVLRQYRIGKQNGVNVHYRCPSSWTAKMVEFYTKFNRSKRYFDCVKVLTRLGEKHATNASDWTVGPTDLAGPRRSAGPPPKCTVCRRFGHIAEVCRKRKRDEVCVMCGTEGHDLNTCEKSVCLSCGTAQQEFPDSCEYCESLRECRCTVCNEMGHEQRSCPENWRRFHDNTSPEPEEISKVVDQHATSISRVQAAAGRDEPETATVVLADRIESNGAGRPKRKRITMN